MQARMKRARTCFPPRDVSDGVSSDSNAGCERRNRTSYIPDPYPKVSLPRHSGIVILMSHFSSQTAVQVHAFSTCSEPSSSFPSPTAASALLCLLSGVFRSLQQSLIHHRFVLST